MHSCRFRVVPFCLALPAVAIICFAAGKTAAGEPNAVVPKLPLLVTEDFEHGASAWQPTDPAAWKLASIGGSTVYSLYRQSKYEPHYRSPINYALLAKPVVGNFVFELRAQSTVKDYPHRDMVFVFGYQDPDHFYYAHLAKSSDRNANQIFIVRGQDRVKISTRTSSGTPWDDRWHQVKIVRTVGDGSIAVYFDDMQHPAMEARDKTFTSGRVGIGSFDDTGNFDDLKLYGDAR